MEERWKHVFGYHGLYAVSDHGRVFSFRNEKLLVSRTKRKKNKPSYTYRFVELSRNGVSKQFAVHRLVLDAFRGPRKEGHECRHLDGNSENNNLCNLAWGNFWENREDAHKHRKAIKLTPDLVRYIRGSRKSIRVLAAELGVSKSTVHYARGGFWTNYMEKTDT